MTTYDYSGGTITLSIVGTTATVIVDALPTVWTLSDTDQVELPRSALLVDAATALRAAVREAAAAERVSPPRSCEHCGSEFQARAAHARYCSTRCRVAAHRQAHRSADTRA